MNRKRNNQHRSKWVGVQRRKKDDIIKEERDSVVGEEDDFAQALKQELLVSCELIKKKNLSFQMFV